MIRLFRLWRNIGVTEIAVTQGVHAVSNSVPRQRVLSADETHLAHESAQVLAGLLRSGCTSHQIELRDDSGAVQTIRIPTAALRLLCDALGEMERGHPVTLTPLRAELTTQEAANLLNVSRPFLVRLLEQGDIPFRKTGTHRRVRYDDLMSYKGRVDKQRRQALEELAAQAQALGLGY
ncbi:MAG: helix-turn-helix domain-containing protein [Rhodocyclaceae bacterium]|nr:helix-turn-helix domain-containing protein [Rhodocyclaceae bacterium]